MKFRGRILLPLIQTFIVVYSAIRVGFSLAYGFGDAIQIVESLIIATAGIGCAYFQFEYMYQETHPQLHAYEQIKKQYK